MTQRLWIPAVGSRYELALWANLSREFQVDLEKRVSMLFNWGVLFLGT